MNGYSVRYQKCDDYPIMFIGLGRVNQMVFKLVNQVIDPRSQIISLEDFEALSSRVTNYREYAAFGSDVKLKEKIVDSVKSRGGNFISVIGSTNIIAKDCEIGSNVFINSHNDLSSNGIVIGDNSIISSFCQISYDTKIGSGCTISAYTYANSVELGKGTIVGIRSSFLGDQNNRISIPSYTNITTGSRVTHTITDAGTYYGNKKLNEKTSLDLRIL